MWPGGANPVGFVAVHVLMLAGGVPHGFGWPPPFVHCSFSVILASAVPSTVGAIATLQLHLL